MKAWNRFKKSYVLYSFKRDPIAISSFSVLGLRPTSSSRFPIALQKA